MISKFPFWLKAAEWKQWLFGKESVAKATDISLIIGQYSHMRLVSFDCWKKPNYPEHFQVLNFVVTLDGGERFFSQVHNQKSPIWVGIVKVLGLVLVVGCGGGC